MMEEPDLAPFLFMEDFYCYSCGSDMCEGIRTDLEPIQAMEMEDSGNPDCFPQRVSDYPTEAIQRCATCATLLPTKLSSKAIRELYNQLNATLAGAWNTPQSEFDELTETFQAQLEEYADAEVDKNERSIP